MAQGHRVGGQEGEQAQEGAAAEEEQVPEAQGEIRAAPGVGSGVGSGAGEDGGRHEGEEQQVGQPEGDGEGQDSGPHRGQRRTPAPGVGHQQAEAEHQQHRGRDLAQGAAAEHDEGRQGGQQQGGDARLRRAAPAPGESREQGQEQQAEGLVGQVGGARRLDAQGQGHGDHRAEADGVAGRVVLAADMDAVAPLAMEEDRAVQVFDPIGPGRQGLADRGCFWDRQDGEGVIGEGGDQGQVAD